MKISTGFIGRPTVSENAPRPGEYVGPVKLIPFLIWSPVLASGELDHTYQSSKGC